MIPSKSDKKTALWVGIDTRSRLYGLKSQYPNLTFDGIINQLIEKHGDQQAPSNQPLKKKDPFWGRY